MTSRVLDLKLIRASKSKRLYSKGGCRECKRRKIKCDEAKPHCWQCARLKKECSYPAVGEKVLRGPKTLLEESVAAKLEEQMVATPISMKASAAFSSDPFVPPQNPHSYPIQSHLAHANHANHSGHAGHAGHASAPTFASYPPHSSQVLPQLLPHPQLQPYGVPYYPPLQTQIQVPPPPPPQPVQPPQHLPPHNLPPQQPANSSPSRTYLLRPSIINLLNENDSNASYRSPLNQLPSSNSQSNQEVSGDDEIFQLFVQNDLNVLATDLNNIVNSIIFESNFDKKDDNLSLENLFNDTTFAVNMSSTHHPWDTLPRNIPLDYINLSRPHERQYLQEFYDNFSSILLPFNSYDSTKNQYFNPARDIILRVSANESYLLAAILAHGARSAYKRNNLAKDEEAYCLYLSKCLELLGPALIDDKRLAGGSLTSNVEAVLLTVLLLTAANAANSLQNWRPHLQGAKDLLLKNSNHNNKTSKVLVFCKSWFVALEILAGISSKMGGTLNTDEEIDLLINSGNEYEVSVLKELGIILENGFSIMCGYHYTCIDQFRDLIKLLNKRRNFQKQNLNTKYLPEPSFAYLKLLSELYYKSEIEFINKKCILNPHDFPNSVVPSGYLIDYIKSTGTVISWQDTSHQAYVLAAQITVLTDFFNELYNSPQVQFLCNRLTTLVSFLNKGKDVHKQLMKCSLMMLLWPMFVVGVNCNEEDAKSLLDTYFRLSAEVGSEGAIFALKRINKIWDRHRCGLSDDGEDEEGSVDLVSY